jgi:FeS assembly SUF system protein
MASRKEKQKIIEEFLENDVVRDVAELAKSEVTEPSLSEVKSEESFEKKALRLKVIEALKTVHDPEIPVNIYDLGLVYQIHISDDNLIKIEMTLTAPACPVAHLFPSMVQGAVNAVDEVTDTEVEIVWDPPWTQDRMSDAAKLELGMF